jgi:hypothetical protein
MNFEFLRSNVFVEVSQSNYLETLDYIKYYGFNSDASQHYDAESHEIYYTRELTKERWNELCGDMPENSNRVIGYKADETLVFKLSNELYSGGMDSIKGPKLMATPNGSGQRYYLLNLIVGLPMEHDSLNEEVYHAAA